MRRGGLAAQVWGGSPCRRGGGGLQGAERERRGRRGLACLGELGSVPLDRPPDGAALLEGGGGAWLGGIRLGRLLGRGGAEDERRQGLLPGLGLQREARAGGGGQGAGGAEGGMGASECAGASERRGEGWEREGETSSSAQRVPRSQTGSLPSFEKPSRRPMTEVGDGPPGLGASSGSSASWYSRGSIATAATTRSRSAELSSSRLLSSGSGKASSIIPVTLPARSSSPCLARALMRW